MKNIVPIFIISLFIGLSNGYAQKGSITGVVADKETKEKLFYVNVVAFLSENTAPLVSLFTDKDGVFKLENLPIGDYRVLIKFIGYEHDTIKSVKIKKQNQKVNIGNIELRPWAIGLDTKMSKQIYIK